MFYLLENRYYNNVSLNRRSLNKIINVYQENYVNQKAQGLGDYLRGSYCLYQICKNIGLQFEINFKNHPMSKFLDNDDIQYPTQVYNNTYHCPETNYIHTTNGRMMRENNFYGKLVRFLNNANNIYDNTLLISCNSFPIWDNINDDIRNHIKSKLNPNETMKKYVEETLNDLGLREKEYGIIHVRCGDKFLNSDCNNGELENKYHRVLSVINTNTNPDKKYILISDSVELKKKLKDLPNIFVYLKKITHLGEAAPKTDETVKNTLLDFFIMSKANSILSISKYAWGSGFSEWCAVTYKIPLQKKLILEETATSILRKMNLNVNNNPSQTQHSENVTNVLNSLKNIVEANSIIKTKNRGSMDISKLIIARKEFNLTSDSIDISVIRNDFIKKPRKPIALKI